MLVGGHGDANPNTTWLQSRGLWFSYVLGMLALHILLLSIPGLSIPVAWTLTNVIHNLGVQHLEYETRSTEVVAIPRHRTKKYECFPFYQGSKLYYCLKAHLVFLHTLKGAPWLSQDQGDCRRLTHWEQIDDGVQYTGTRRFLSTVPVILFFLTSFYTKYDTVHFYINFVSLLIVLIPKLPQFHKVRIFGINKY